ncbi:MAG: hypothetical protein IJ449_06230 [Clostridia bacterium]|nr:hypothetical protein [Clostridia bacterium]
MNYNPFQKAVPVWPAGRDREMNVTARFTAAVNGNAANTLLRMTGSTVYRVFVNGKIAAYGPARGPKFFHRVDELNLTPILTDGENIIVFEVAGYNVNNYYTMDQPSFFQAEILCDNNVVAWTAAEGGMPCDVVTERVQKVQKYSFQRPFVEVWRMGAAYAASLGQMTPGRTPLAEVEEKEYLPRRVPFPSLTYLPAVQMVGKGSIAYNEESADKWRNRSLDDISPILKGYPKAELEVNLSADMGAYVCTAEEMEPTAVPDVITLEKDRFATVKLNSNLTGFIGAHVKAKKHTTLIITFDELFDGDVNTWRMGCVNIVRYDLDAGEYDLLTMEPFTMQYLKYMVVDGEAEISGIHLTEYAAPEKDFVEYRSDNEKFLKIWEAAVQTYRQNAVDLFTDCPCRERAGWLCDSFWTARVEYALTGKCVVEKNFLENFLLPDSFECLPKGMFPMCYPSDHYNENYIPNWAMWLVMELREYWDRSGDREMIDAFEPKLYDLVEFFNQYINEDGLLENLDKWIFVEWSRANYLVAGVNFPSNMLYAACLEAMSEMYDDPALKEQADSMRETIRRLSFNGKFFVDQMLRDENGKLYLQGEVTEVCQYYAFYCGTATKELYPELWNTLLYEFGPYRKENNKHPDVHFANAFIGNYLRLDMMAKNDNMKEVLDNIEGYFYNMALMTGTLWENDSTVASLDHGFASHVIVWLLRDMIENNR